MSKLLFFILFFMPVLLYAQDKTFPELSKALDNEMAALKKAQSNGDKILKGHSNGSIAETYLELAQLPPENIQPNSLISADKNVNLNKCIDYANKSIESSEEIGDEDQMKASYKTLYAAQKMNGDAKGAVSTYGKMIGLKHTLLNQKQTKEYQRRRLEYEYNRKEDSIRRQQQMVEEQAKEQVKLVQQQNQQQIQASNQMLNNAQKEKENVSRDLEKTKTDLTMEKSESEYKTQELTRAEEEKALQATQVQLQQSKLQLQQNEIEMKDKVLEQRKRQQIFYILGLVGLLAISGLVYRNFVIQKKSNLALTHEKKRSEELLLNILPEEVAGELIKKGFADAKHFHDVTVLFTDFVNFTAVTETMPPQELVGELHVCFKAFDMILSKYHIEKIKTIGDAYMAVSGLPLSNPNHAPDIVAAAIEIRDFMAKRQQELGDSTFGVRIGINSGNVVAGIVGVRKFAYDIWGDTVNIAARMEQNSEEGKINISETTYQLVKDKYACVYRGKIQAKNKGGIDMYFLS